MCNITIVVMLLFFMKQKQKQINKQQISEIGELRWMVGSREQDSCIIKI